MKNFDINALNNFLKPNFNLILKLALLIQVISIINLIKCTTNSDNNLKIIEKELIQIKSENRFDIEINNNRNSKIFEFEHIKINFSIQKHSNNIYDLEDFHIPSDLIEFFPKNENFELILNQGRIPDSIRNKALYNSSNSNENSNKINALINQKEYIKPGNYFTNDFILTDLPAGFMIFMGSNEFIDFSSKKNLKLFFDVFSYVFKITLSPIMDRTNYVNFLDYYLMTENTEKACSDHLDGIKNILPLKVKKLYEKYVNYKSFVESDFKSIKIQMQNDLKSNSIKFAIKILYRNVNFKNSLESINNNNNNNQITSLEKLSDKPTYKIIKLATLEADKIINILSSTFESTWNFEKYLINESPKDKEILMHKFTDFNMLSSYSNVNSKRFLIGEIHGFENLNMNHKLKITSSSKNVFRIIDLIPGTLDILFSTIKIDLKLNFFLRPNRNKNNYNNLVDHFNKEEFDLKFSSEDTIFRNFIKFFFTEQIELQNPKVSFTYENKKSTQLNFSLSENFFENFYLYLKSKQNENDSKILLEYLDSIDFINSLKNENSAFIYEIDLKLSYELRKKILNFESMENENEVGYKIPSGVVLLVDKQKGLPFLIRLNNHIYFNYPDVDGTMPFNIIALSWVVYGFLFIQTLNLFLVKKGEEEKSLLQTIKDRFMAKWGFLFGR